MWIITADGLYSVVAPYSDQPDTLVVRSRVKADAQHLCDWLNEHGTQAKIEHTPLRDYLYRLTVDKQVFAAYMTEQILRIDYRNFKAEVAKRQGWKREAVYEDVWATLATLQMGAV